MTIPRSTQSARAPSSTRRPAGDLHGPAPVAHQVREITARVEQLPDGRWRLTQPRVPGWAAVARTPGEVAAALRQGFTEAQVAAYSDWRGCVNDLASTSYRRSRPTARSRQRCDVYQATEWRLSHDGRWISPRGHKYPENREVVQRVMSAREAMGLPARPDPVSPDYVRPQTRTVQRRDWAGAVVALTASAARLSRPLGERSAV